MTPDCVTNARDRRFFLVAFWAGLAWNAIFLAASTGWSLDDELSHFLRSRSVWQNPELIFDVWTRFGRNLFHVLPALGGLTAARIWTLAFATLAVWLTTLLAGRLGLKRLWLVPLALWFQPWFVELSWGILTQTPFLLALVAGIWFLTTRRWILSGLCMGWLPLIRHEGIALLGLWGLLLVVPLVQEGPKRIVRLFLAGLASLLPLAIYNVSAWWFIGEIPSRIYFEPKPTEMYGSGPLWHFFVVCLAPAGFFTIVLATLGLGAIWRVRALSWPFVFYPVYFGLHVLIFWKGLFASGGYYHFLMPIAPGLAVAAALGAENLLTRGRKPLAVLLTGGLVIQGLLMLHVLAMQRWAGATPGFGLRPEPIHRAISQALAWQALNRPDAPAVVCRHIYAAWRRDWQETPAQCLLNQLPLEDLPAGTIVIWEYKYSNHTGVTLAELLNPEEPWKELRAWGAGAVRVFEKKSEPPSPPEDGSTPLVR